MLFVPFEEMMRSVALVAIALNIGAYCRRASMAA
jgi:hypothetical protein